MSTVPLAVDAAPPASAADRMSLTGGPANPAEPPVTVIEPRTDWRFIDFPEVWRYRELLYFLAWRDIKVQYKQTVLGPVWAVLRPVMNLVVFSVVFGRLARIPSDGLPYPIFVYAGMLPWAFFSSAVVAAGNSLLNHAHLLSKIYFPRVLLPAASIVSALATLAIHFALYACVMIGYAHLPGIAVLLLPVLVVLTAMTALGIGCLLAGLAVIYRDIRFVVGSVVGAWMYLSPVIYPVTLVPERYRWLLVLNPMTGIIGAFRSALLGRPVDFWPLAYSAGFAVVALVAGLLVFHRTERRVVDLA